MSPESRRIVIVTAGPMRAGKSTIAEYLERRYHASVFSISSWLKLRLKELGRPISRYEFCKLATLLVESYGRESIVEPIIAMVQREFKTHDGDKICVIDGCRFSEQVYLLQTHFVEVRIIAVDADIRIRHERALRAGGKADEATMTLVEFEAFHSEPTELEVPQLMRLAERVIIHESSFEDLYAQLEQQLHDWDIPSLAD